MVKELVNTVEAGSFIKAVETFRRNQEDIQRNS